MSKLTKLYTKMYGLFYVSFVPQKLSIEKHVTLGLSWLSSS